MSLRLVIFLMLAVLNGPRLAVAEDVTLCRGVVASEPVSPALDDLEKRLVCGDDREGWRNVPHNQAKFQLRSFLQARGYHRAEFESRGEILYVTVNEPTRISKITASGEPEPLDITRRRGITGQILTPARLNELEAWVKKKLGEHGFACPQVRSRANPDTGAVVVEVEEGRALPVAAVLEEPSLLPPGVLRRYDAFQLGRLYDERELALTERRILSEGIVQAVRFEVDCREQGVFIEQKVTPGLPRAFSFGFGFNTEDGFRVRGGWRHSRLFRMSSSVDVMAVASLREQKIESTMKWYLLPQVSRFYLLPKVTVRREDEPKYELLNVAGHFIPTYEMDTDSWFIRAGVGPTLEETRLLEGVGPGFSRLLLLTSDIEGMSHDFEFNRNEPVSGMRLNLRTGHVLSHGNARVNAHQFRLDGQWLVNFASFEPPLLVLGGRFGFATTAAESVGQIVTELPAQFRYFLGGLSNLRGFGRQELPFHGVGALTMGFVGLEARSTGLLPQNLQPYLFVDAGQLGSNSWTLQNEVYWSPGLGLRWSSPIGVFRFNVAHGNVANAQPETPQGLSHWQFYLAYGEEF
ncbi:MAG TPA: BamA/TamA family outer membrane protein [Bdellovibrionales bacterium]|nr:BamA/TamA family outer membrane protein [Bdellovibrionales bacterium]